MYRRFTQQIFSNDKKKSYKNQLHIHPFFLIIFSFLVATLIIKHNPGNKTFRSLVPSVVHDQGDCNAIGPRRPLWYNRETFLRSIPEFRKLYEHRPFKRNSGGMRFDHSFALWFILKHTRPTPKFVIESGAHRGHSTWIIRNSLPSVTIVSLSPEKPKINLPQVMYFNEINFTDFGKFDFQSIGVNPKESVVFFDDH